MNTVVLITGYARAGKDTLAEGIFLAATKPAFHINFADSLKQACDAYMQILEVGGSGATKTFRNEAFKVRHRDFLVAAGTFARDLDRDVFALSFCRQCKRIADSHPGQDITVVCSDWRYINEYGIVSSILGGAYGWQVYTAQISTSDVHAANEEEGKSIGEIVRNIPVNLGFTFWQDSKQAVISEGKNVARQLGL